MKDIVTLLTLLCAIDAFGFIGLLAIVGILFRQHDQSVLAELRRLTEVVKGKAA
jgi:hypothetical protein